MIVVDASLALKWLIEEDRSDDAIVWAAERDLIAPTLLRLEVASALLKKVRRREITAEAARLVYPQLPNFIAAWAELGPYVDHAFAIALELDHPPYDCLYLALAQHEGQGVATADLKLIERCRGTAFESMLIDW